MEEFKQSGWEVRPAGESIKLYSTSRAGTIKKYATVEIQRNYDVVIRISLDSDSGTTERRLSDRPWYVFGPTYLQFLVGAKPQEAGQAYKHLNKAVSVFLDEARRYAPKSNKPHAVGNAAKL